MMTSDTFPTAKRCLILVLLGLLFLALPLLALTESPREDSLLYYKIGGGRHISIPPSMTITTIDLSLTGSYSGLNCGAFDPIVSIKSSLDNLKDGVDDAINAIEAAAGAAIANLPGYILQKANPGLYDLFQNGLLRAQESFSLATKSCERMEYEIANNINPYAEWITLSRGDAWKTSVGLGERNIHKAVDEAKTAHNQGFTWIGGLNRGGDNQPAARILSDVATAGLNILSQRPPETQTNLPSNAPLRQHFEGPKAVREWVTDILGDLVIGTCDTCVNGSQAGKGLIPAIEDEAEAVKALLTDLVRENTRPSRTNLEQVAAPGIAITLQVITAIQNLSPAERDIVIDKLAQEIAETRLMEAAMIVRRLLLVGSKEGHVSSKAMAKNEVNRALEELNHEIDNVIFEKKVRREWVTHTLVEVLLKDQALRQAAANAAAAPPTDDQPLQQGGVRP